MNLPNLLTLLRIFFVPLLVAALVQENLSLRFGHFVLANDLLALAIFLVASATDLLTPESSWNTNYPNPVVNASLNQNQLTLGTTNAAAFFRLMRP